MDRQEHFIDREPSNPFDDIPLEVVDNDQDSRPTVRQSPKIKQYHAEEQMVFRKSQILARKEQLQTYHRDCHERQYREIQQNDQRTPEQIKAYRSAKLQEDGMSPEKLAITMSILREKANEAHNIDSCSQPGRTCAEEQTTFDYHNGKRWLESSNGVQPSVYPSNQPRSHCCYPHKAPECRAAIEQHMPWEGARRIDLFTGLDHNYPFVTLPSRGYQEDEGVSFCNQRQWMPVTDCRASKNKWPFSNIRE
ncbi:hypothetical protein CLU79DRAFT_830575 [Phycomyces nitens]|nr:hypothetical protein CLU79DRAFT_830575 [Phycomyces nitens]